jgi:hypothetical protein
MRPKATSTSLPRVAGRGTGHSHLERVEAPGDTHAVESTQVGPEIKVVVRVGRVGLFGVLVGLRLVVDKELILNRL